MKISGIICEYNPLHNGHLHHIRRTRENGATHIIAVMSGNFVQRGETAVMDKFTRAALALSGGVDLVLEIPAVYCLSSAEFYAGAAVKLLCSLGCVGELSFGSECGDVELLKETAQALSGLPRESAEKLMKDGVPYPAAAAELLRRTKGPQAAAVISAPNNILAVEYLKALKGSDIEPFTIKRSGAEHDSENPSGDTASASCIRKFMSEGRGFESFVPAQVSSGYRKLLRAGKVSDMRNLERVILYKLRTVSISELRTLPDVGQGLEYRLKDAACSGSLAELCGKVKTKRYTMARIKRILLNMLIGSTPDDLKIPPPYGRILALNEKGREILAACKNSAVPLSTSLARLSGTGKNAGRIASLEGAASDIYGLSLGNIGSRDDDFRASVRIM